MRLLGGRPEKDDHGDDNGFIVRGGETEIEDEEGFEDNGEDKLETKTLVQASLCVTDIVQLI